MTSMLAILLVSTFAAAGQERAPGRATEKTYPMSMALKAGGKVYDFNGQGRCLYAPAVSIHGMRAERWSAERTGDGLAAALTAWRPAIGTDMVTVAFTVDDTRYSMSTLKIGAKGTPEGSGTVTIARDGPAATFTFSGTAGNGTPISGTVKCAGFGRPNEEGGD